MNSPNIIFVSIIPYFTLWVKIPRRSKVDEVASSADMNYFTLCCTGLLPGDDGGDGLRGKGVACVDGDVVFCAGGFDFFEVCEVAGDDAVNIKGRLEGGVSASNVGSYLPIWVGLLEGSSVGS